MNDSPVQWSLRPETPSDEAFSMGLFASTRAGEMACLAGAPAVRETFLRIQHQAQKRAYDVLYPFVERSIVVVSGEPVGRLLVDRSSPDIRLVDIALLPEHRGRGTGTALLLSLLDEARRTGRKVLLHVVRGNPAVRLYERLGFTRKGGTEMHDAMEWRPPAASTVVDFPAVISRSACSRARGSA
jgi:GNAT superfamily N-acetyltransferase